MFHCPEANQGACAPEPGLAVNGDGSGFVVSDTIRPMIFGELHPVLNDLVGRRGAVDEEKIVVCNARL